jgi:hypothetical protein
VTASPGIMALVVSVSPAMAVPSRSIDPVEKVPVTDS